MVKRKANGQWDKGTEKPPGSGRKSGPTWQDQLRGWFLDTVTEDDAREIVRVQVGLAKQGNQDAARLVLPFIVPKPPEQHEHSGRDGAALVQVIEVVNGSNSKPT